MANKKAGARQPLAQARPGKAGSNKKSPKLVAPKLPPRRPRPHARPSALDARRPGRGAVRGRAARRAPKDVPAYVADVYARLAGAHPDAHCELAFETPLQLLVATILSAQCTDKRVNMVTPELFRRYPTVESLAAARQEELEGVIKTTGFFRNKAKSIIAMANALVDRHGGEVPAAMEDLVKLPGVGRKTANVILGNAFGVNDGIVVDTHVGRLAARLGLTRETDPVKVEQALLPLFPREQWAMVAHVLIFHGRRVCEARKPRCEVCVLRDVCPSSLAPGPA